MNINETVKIVHNMAKEKGCWASSRSPLELQMLIVSEIAEACEEARQDNPPIYLATSPNFTAQEFPKNTKPSGELIELADAVIRIMDYCGSRQWDLEKAIQIKMEYNASRPHRHGGKKF